MGNVFGESDAYSLLYAQSSPQPEDLGKRVRKPFKQPGSSRRDNLKNPPQDQDGNGHDADDKFD